MECNMKREIGASVIRYTIAITSGIRDIYT